MCDGIESFMQQSTGKCIACRNPEHDQCPLVANCSCCKATMDEMRYDAMIEESERASEEWFDNGGRTNAW